MTPTLSQHRLLALATTLALLTVAAEAGASSTPASVPAKPPAPACLLGTFRCAPRPPNYALCRPNALLEFYDPALSMDSSLRPTSPTLIDARSVDSSNQSIYHLSGNVKLQRADQQLQADAVEYNRETTDYAAHGDVRFQEAGQLLSAASMQGNTEADRGVAKDVRYQLLNSHGNGVAEQGQLLDAMHSRYVIATYSTCDVGHHVWEFRARTITIDKETGVGVARDATVRLGKVPFLYLPYFSFPTDDRRKSGFLYPLLAHTSRSGFEIDTPYYLNLAPNYDATLDPRYYSERGPMLGGEFRYLVPGTYGQLGVQYVPHDHGTPSALADTRGTQRYLINFSDYTKLWDDWAVRTSINRTSDSSYLYDFANKGQANTIYSLASSAALVGGNTWWNAAFGGIAYQNTNPFLTASVLPYRQLPYATFNLDMPISRWLEGGMSSTAVAFRKPGYVSGERVDLYPYLAATFGNAAWFVKPRLAYRYTAYQLGSSYTSYGYYGLLGSGATSPLAHESPSRALPVVSVDSGLVFDRATSLFGQSYTQTLEPRLYYLYVPYRNQDQLPLFDTNVMTFNYWQLFSANQYSGADRQMNANNLTGAITSRLLDENGVERLSASFGQIRYFTPQRVQLPTGQETVAPGTDWGGSDYVAQLDLQLSSRWRFSSAYQWNPNTRRSDVAVVEIQRRIQDDGVVNFSYQFRRGLLEQYNASVVYPLSESWRLVGVLGWSVPDRRMVEALGGVEFDSCCVSLRLVVRSYVNQGYYGYGSTSAQSNLEQRDNEVLFQFEFKGLGTSGGQLEPILRRDILGYQ
ncbi:MAG: LPS assembly protein LptD [Rhodanobacter sp.]